MIRQALERSLLESELRLRAVVSNAPLILFALDRRGIFTLSEGRGLGTLGRAPGQVVGRSVFELYAGQPAILDGVRQALAGEQCAAVVELAGHTFDAWYVPVRGDDDGVTGVIGVAIDSTARYHAERDLRRQRDFAEQVMEALGHGLAVTDRHARLTYVNPAFARLLGLPPERLLGKTPLELLVPAERGRLEQLAAERAAGAGSSYESRLLHASGHEVPVLITGTPRYDEGVFAGTIAAVADLTRHKELEAALQAANERLTAQVAALQARTRAMTLLNELGERLQNVDVEAGGVVAIAARYLPQLFPDHAGVLYLLGPGDGAEPVAAWGDLRAIGDDGGHRIQLQVQGEALGWLALSPEPGPHVEEDVLALWLRDARAAAHQIALALANLRLRETLRRQASSDELTGLLNRRALLAALHSRLAHAADSGAPLCVVMGDIDHFKRINDSGGHGAGDAVIRQVAEVLRECAGPGGLACRYGGEELVMVLPGSDLAAGVARAEALRAAVAALIPRHDGVALGQITISLGVAAYPQHGTTVDALLRAADGALYAGKFGGRNRVVAAGAGP